MIETNYKSGGLSGKGLGSKDESVWRSQVRILARSSKNPPCSHGGSPHDDSGLLASE